MDPGEPMEPAKAAAAHPEDDEDNSSIDVVDRQKERLRDLCEQFEKVVFEPLDTEEDAIKAYLTELFDDEEKQTTLEELRKDVCDAGEWLLRTEKPFSKDVLKQELRKLTEREGIWRWHAGATLTKEDLERRAYYLGYKQQNREIVSGYWRSGMPPRGEPYTVNQVRKDNYIDNSFTSSLPSRIECLDYSAYDNDGEDEDADDFGLDSPGDDDGSKTPRVSTKQFLLRTLATELVLQRALNGSTAIVQSDLKWFGATLSHATIFAVMRFFDFPESLVTFFRKVLEAPLHLSSSSSGPRTRRRGMPMARVPEKLIGELVLFVLDFAVNQETGLLLYRLHDDLWVAGPPAQTYKAWTTMKHFAKVMGLEYNERKTGSVYLADRNKKDAEKPVGLPCGDVKIGHLMLNPDTEICEIDRSAVAEHVVQLRRQLAESRSVLDWVRTWNSCISRFFGHTFGEPAYCFGKEHVYSILNMYKQMERDIFGVTDVEDANPRENSALDYIKTKIEERFGVSRLSDAFVIFPEQLGGLGLRNPFIPFLLVKEALEVKTFHLEELVSDFLRDDREEYEQAQRDFYAKSGWEREQQAQKVLPYFRPSEVLRPDEFETFFSFEEWTTNWELTSWDLRFIYQKLQSKAYASTALLDTDVTSVLSSSLKISKNNDSLAIDELRWILQMYRDEAREEFDGLRLVEETFLPLGVIAMLGKQAVRWGMVL